MFRMSRGRTIVLLPVLLLPLIGTLTIASAERATEGSAEALLPREAVFRGTTNLRAAARAGADRSALPGLSLDRIRRKSEPIGEGGHDLLLPPGAAPVVTGSPVAGPPHSLLTSFDGLGAFDNESVSGFNVEPPDQGLCVGNGFVLESINVTIQAFDGAGTALGAPVEQNTFYGFPPGFELVTGRSVRSSPTRPVSTIPRQALVPHDPGDRHRPDHWRLHRAEQHRHRGQSDEGPDRYLEPLQHPCAE